MAALLWVLIVVLAVIWLFGFLLAHVASPLIHLLLVVALILLIWNLITGSRTTV
jgi:hypothetical protein